MADFSRRRVVLGLAGMAGLGFATPRIAHAETIEGITSHYSQLSEWRRLTALVGLDKALINPNVTYTAFVPTNLAFEYLSEGARNELNNPQNHDILKRVLQYHIVKNQLLLEDLNGRVTQTPTLAGRELTIIGTGPRPKIAEATVIRGDLKGDNGVVHIIDAVLWPRA